MTSSFEYYPGVPIFFSRDLVNWTQIGHVLDRESQLDLTGAPSSGGIYAPTIRYHNGTYFVTSTNVSGAGHFIVHTQDPWAGWSDPVWVDQSGIDPSLFFEADTVLFTSNIEGDPSGPHELNPTFTRGIQQSEIDPFTGNILVPPRLIWEGTGASFPEGPHLYKRADYYYLVIAEGGTEWGHFASVGRSLTPWGPFEVSPRGPLIDHRSQRTQFRSMGHADLVELDSDKWWAVCLGIRSDGGWPTHVLGRETFLAPVDWDDQGWPKVGDAGIVQRTSNLPALARTTEQNAPTAFRDDFSTQGRRPEWQTLRTAQLAIKMSKTTPGLVLTRTGSALDDPDPVFVGYRLQDHHFDVQVALELPLLCGDETAGVAVRMNENFFYALEIRGNQGELNVSLRQRLGDVTVSTDLGTLPTGQTHIRVTGDGDFLHFSVRADTRPALVAPPVRLRMISTEIAGGFTGAFIGPYTAGTASTQRAVTVTDFKYEVRAAITPLTDPGH